VGQAFAPNDDAEWMRLALLEAAAGLGYVEPNPLVGAIVVRNGTLAGAGHHERFGGPHAEVLALAAAGDRAKDATLYVTLEPCCHFGKTPPCTDAIIAAGVSRVVVAMPDPYPEVNGKGLSVLRDAGIQVDVGCNAQPARALNAPYLKRVITGLPFVTAKWAMTLDGKTAAASGDSRWISSEESRRTVHDLRARMDAVIVGIGTAEADDPLLTARVPAPPRRAARIVLDSTCRLPVASRLAQTARESPVLIAVTDRANPAHAVRLADLGCEILAFPAPASVPIDVLLAELGRRGMTNVLVEGGGRVAGSFFDAGHVDAVDVFVAPIVEGGDHARTPIRGRGHTLMRDAIRLARVEVSQTGGDSRVRGYLVRLWWHEAGLVGN
jgi:diaminohydroxyphosphoribosylaminopyrimidine deaminase / 5-amino-6-(5-phosphoribosylamino)uracil reductase